MVRAIGIDACKGGWVVVETTSADFGTAHAHVVSDIETFVSRPDDVTVIDIPIGLPESTRSCDRLARHFLGPRRSSVFAVPCRQAISAASHAQANVIHRQETQSGLSVQSFGIFAKIRKIDAAMRQGRTLREGHPELSFRIMSGADLAAKSSARGVFERMALLQSLGFRLSDLASSLSSKVAVDDLLDACALAWTARRVATDRHRSFPETPEVDMVGLSMQMVA